MSVSLSRRSLARLPRPSASRTYSTMGYVPHQATHNIEPVQIRAKPPPHFFTGQPNFYVAITTLEKTLLEIQERLRLARCFPLTKDHPKQPKNDFEWRSQEEITLLLGTPNIKGLEFKRFIRVCERLVRVRHAAEVATDLKSAERITDLITPFTIANPSADATAAIIARVYKKREPDAHGRTRTIGTRKNARAEVWMQYTPALAAVFHDPVEKARLAKRAHDIEKSKVVEELRLSAEKESGAKSLGPVFTLLDLETSRAKREKKRAGLDPGPSSELVVAPIEKVWKAEVEKRERVEKLARDMLKERKLTEKAEAETRAASKSASSSSSSTSPPKEASSSSSSTTQEAPASSSFPSSSPEPDLTPEEAAIEAANEEIYTRVSSSERGQQPSSPYFKHHQISTLPAASPSDPKKTVLPPTAYATYKANRKRDIASLHHVRDQRSTVLSPASSNSPISSPEHPKDGTIVVQNTTSVEPPSDPAIGQILVNGVPIHRFFEDPKHRETILRPLKVARLLGAFNIFAIVKQGGHMGAAEAMSLAIAKGIAIHQPAAKQAMGRDGLLGTDHRQVERKKTGMLKARKQEVWVKR